jgi:hypothetical protein
MTTGDHEARDPKGRRKRNRARAPSALSPFAETPPEVAALLRAAERDMPGLRAALDQEGFAFFKKKPGYGYVRKDTRKHLRKVRSPREDPDFAALADEVVEHKRTLLGHDRLYTLYQTLQNVLASTGEDEALELLEVGVYRGGSSYFLANAARRLTRQRIHFVAVDTFEGHSAVDLPEGSEGPHEPSSFAGTSYDEVCEYLVGFDFLEVVKGRFQDVATTIAGREIHLAHVDVDIYAPTSFALRFLGDRLVQGGAVVVDDYGFVTCPGVKKAVDEFVSENSDRFFKLTLETGQCCLVATGPPPRPS